MLMILVVDYARLDAAYKTWKMSKSDAVICSIWHFFLIAPVTHTHTPGICRCQHWWRVTSTITIRVVRLCLPKKQCNSMPTHTQFSLRNWVLLYKEPVGNWLCRIDFIFSFFFCFLSINSLSLCRKMLFLRPDSIETTWEIKWKVKVNTIHLCISSAVTCLPK